MTQIADLVNRTIEGGCVPFGFSVDGAPAHFRPLGLRSRDGEYVLAYRAVESPLLVHLILRRDPDWDTVTLTISLWSEGRTGRLSDVRILDVSLPGPAPRMRGCTGGFVDCDEDKVFPPRFWRVHEWNLDAGAVTCEERTGACSNTWLPLWVMQSGKGGIYVCPECYGSWKMRAEHQGGATRLAIGLPFLDFRMSQGEELALPPVTLGGFRGDLDDGCNRLRRFIRDAVMPDFRDRGKPLLANHVVIGGNDPRLDAEGMRCEVGLAAELGCEASILASCWIYDADYVPRRRTARGRQLPDGQTLYIEWPERVGDYHPGPKRFPNGIRAFGNEVRRLGMLFGLWVDPAVSTIADEYAQARDVLIGADALTPQQAQADMDERNVYQNLPIDLAHVQGRAYLLDLMDRIVDEYGADILWFDFNTRIRSAFFDDCEQEGRRGVHELRYYAGMDEVLGEFRRRHPDTWLMTCCSGGRLINLGMLRHSNSVWVNDYSAHPAEPRCVDTVRSVVAAANLFLPSELVHYHVTMPQAVDGHEQFFDLNWSLSLFAGHYTLLKPLLTFPQGDLAEHRAIIARFKELRHLMSGQYYRLQTQPGREDSFDGWQLHDPASGEGLVLAFRLERLSETCCTLPLHGVADGAELNVDVIEGDARVLPTPTGLTVTFGRQRAVMIRYARKDQE
jgi:Melibiase